MADHDSTSRLLNVLVAYPYMKNDLVKLLAVGCERFAEYVYGLATTWVRNQGLADRVRVASVEVMEHGANSAIFMGPQP